MSDKGKQKQFLCDAAGLAQSEANRWDGRDRKTHEHWSQVALLLRAEFLIENAKPTSDWIERAAREAALNISFASLSGRPEEITRQFEYLIKAAIERNKP